MSTEPTTEMMNEVICTFMGRYRKIERQDYFINVYKGPDEIEWETGKYLKYHTSWDWLMPVGKKIRDLLNDMQKKRSPHTACHGDLIEVDIHCAVSSYDIVNAHKNMYIFITWYNQQNQNIVSE